jgi:hypothetical protein
MTHKVGGRQTNEKVKANQANEKVVPAKHNINLPGMHI